MMNTNNKTQLDFWKMMKDRYPDSYKEWYPLTQGTSKKSPQSLLDIDDIKCIVIEEKKDKCIARSWNSGLQCRHFRKVGDFCEPHSILYTLDNLRKKSNCKRWCCKPGKYNWEHTGRCDEHPRYAGVQDETNPKWKYYTTMGWFGEQ